jgi:hypothetical protein
MRWLLCDLTSGKPHCAQLLVYIPVTAYLNLDAYQRLLVERMENGIAYAVGQISFHLKFHRLSTLIQKDAGGRRELSYAY